MSQTIELQQRLLTVVHKNLPDFVRRFLITAQGKYMQLNASCPHCLSHNVVHNGYYSCESKFLLDLGLNIRNGHYLCKLCDRSFSTPYPGTKKFLYNLKTFLKETSFNLFVKGMSFGNISDYFTQELNLTVCAETVRNYYIELAKEYKDKKLLSCSGIFHVDCQFLKVRGKRTYRLTVMDAVDDTCVLDMNINAETVGLIVDKLRLHLLPYDVKGFVVDGKIGLVDALERVFGVPAQRCLPHYQSLIVKDYKQNCGGKLDLQMTRNMYLCLSILFDHDVEVQFLNRKLQEFDVFKQTLICPNDKLREKLTKKEEIRLMNEFIDFRGSLKKHRRKNTPYLFLRSEAEIKAKLEFAELFLTEKFEKRRLDDLKKNLNSLTHHLRIEDMPPTNNGVEHYYSKTLTKTLKKRFKSEESINLKVGAFRAVKNGWFKLTVTFTDILKQFAKLHNMFATPS